jgi:hypothetical protein
MMFRRDIPDVPLGLSFMGALLQGLRILVSATRYIVDMIKRLKWWLSPWGSLCEHP